MVIHIIYRAPGVIDILSSEIIPVVPVSYLPIFIRKLVKRQRTLNLLIRKAELVTIVCSQDGVDLQVIEPRKNGLLRDPKAPCDDSKFQGCVGL